jgi:hypothetical protein
MDLLRWEDRPVLRRPVLLAAFEGWNDAGNAASEAVNFLSRTWEAATFATFDGDELFDFTSSRPQVRLEAGEARRLEWPSVKLARASLPGTTGDVVLLYGPEPQLHWKAFVEEVRGVCWPTSPIPVRSGFPEVQPRPSWPARRAWNPPITKGRRASSAY